MTFSERNADEGSSQWNITIEGQAKFLQYFPWLLLNNIFIYIYIFCLWLHSFQNLPKTQPPVNMGLHDIYLRARGVSFTVKDTEIKDAVYGYRMSLNVN